MQTPPRVSIVIPVFDDEEWVAASLRSCRAQTVSDIEIICVDDASTDGTCAVIEQFQAEDPRIRLIRQPVNRSAFQARREGILAATAPFVMFLDGDDELAPTAVEAALHVADTSGADVVGFGVDVIVPEGVSVGRFVSDMQPKHAELNGTEIVPTLFPVGKVAQGHLWRYLWTTELLRLAYNGIDENLELYRANDIPIAMSALAHATKYVSTEDKLYRYYWRRGVSGQVVESVEDFAFYLGALDSIDSISESMLGIAATLDDSAGLLDTYHSARLSIIQMILRYCTPIIDDDLRAECFARLESKAGYREILLAVSMFYRTALEFIAQFAPQARGLSSATKTVLITTGNLGSGGVQGVVVSQAKYLAEAGFRVIIGLRTFDGIVQEVPEGVELVELAGDNTRQKLESHYQIFRDYEVDALIDHYILYHDDWPYFTLAARSMGIPSIGWIHNFALRPVFDFNTRTSFLTRHLELMEKVVVLSKTDVAFWKLRGLDNVVALPNPASPMILDRPRRSAPRDAPIDGEPIRLVWWGRLQQRTKRVLELVDVAAALRAMGVEFSLSIIGPDSGDLKAHDIQRAAVAKGVEDVVVLPGTLHGDELLAAIDSSDVFVSTSAIEGSPLVLIEAQAMGLPVVMYELPWLAALESNCGIVSSPQNEAGILAQEIAHLASDPATYVDRSRGSIAATDRTLSLEFGGLYTQLLTGQLPTTVSPEPTIDDAKLLLDLTVNFHEANASREGRYAARLREERDTAKRQARSLQLDLDAERRVATERELRIARLSKRVKKSANSSQQKGPTDTARERSNEPWAVRIVRPIGRGTLRLIPGLRPAARKFNRWVRGL
ncbi:glycosyltransferase [Microbacterium indicum]|uniref:glycosyltransferase n=1 Tax=Microbacterium indicum TaxID=358100 RepID=UPI0004165882|nr:glycosyltransferase [Microbacterium indicum]